MKFRVTTSHFHRTVSRNPDKNSLGRFRTELPRAMETTNELPESSVPPAREIGGMNYDLPSSTVRQPLDAL